MKKHANLKDAGWALYQLATGKIGNSGTVLLRFMRVKCPADKKESFQKFNGQKNICTNMSEDAYPDGSFGKSYIQFLAQHKLRETSISGWLANTDNPDWLFANRLAITHDLLHFLLNQGLTSEGESALAGLFEVQHPKRYYRIALMSYVIFTVSAPWNIRKIRRGIKTGKQLGTQARYMYDIDFEQYWQMPLNEVRKIFSIPVPV